MQVSQYTRQVPRRLLSVLLWSVGIVVTRQVPRRLLSVLLWSVDITVYQTGPQASFICSPVECVVVSQYVFYQTGPQASFICSPVECRYHRSPVFYQFSCGMQVSQVPRRLFSVLLWSVGITVYQTGPQASFICSPVECRYHSILARSPGVFYLFSCGVQVSQYTRQVPRRLLSVRYHCGVLLQQVSQYTRQVPRRLLSVLLWSVGITVYQTGPQASFICSPVECRYHSILVRSPGVFSLFSCGVQVSQYTRQVPRRLLSVLLWSVGITVYQTGPQASFICSPVECRYHSILDRSPGVFSLFSCGVQVQSTRQYVFYQVSQVPRRLLSVLLWSVGITVYQTGPQASFISSPVECRYHSILDRSPGVFYLFSCGVQVSQYTNQVPRRLLSVLLWSVGIIVYQSGPQASFISSPVECRYHSILARTPGVFYLFSCGVQVSQYTNQVPRRLLSVLLWSVGITVYQTGPQDVFYQFSCGVQVSQYTSQVPRRLLSVLLWSVGITVYQPGPQASFISSPVECRYHSILTSSPGAFYQFSCGVQVSEYTSQVPRRLLSVLLWSVGITVYQTGPQASFICSPVECRYHSILAMCPQASFICSPVECRYRSILVRSPSVFFQFSCGVQVAQYTNQVPRCLLFVLLWSVGITVYQTGPQASFISSPVECRYHSILTRSPGVFYLFSCGVQVSQYTRQVPRRLLSVLL